MAETTPTNGNHGRCGAMKPTAMSRQYGCTSGANSTALQMTEALRFCSAYSRDVKTHTSTPSLVISAKAWKQPKCFINCWMGLLYSNLCVVKRNDVWTHALPQVDLETAKRRNRRSQHDFTHVKCPELTTPHTKSGLVADTGDGKWVDVNGMGFLSRVIKLWNWW